MKKKPEFVKWILAGILFAALWPSASTATKIGLTVAQPLVIAVVRFALASVIMLLIAHIIKGHRLPQGKEWKQLAVYALLNITIYLGCYVIAMQTVTAGIGALAIATNPVFISFISVFFFNKRLTWNVAVAIFVCTAGVIVAAWPLFSEAVVDFKGLLILLFSMLSYSVGAVYFAEKNWGNLSLVVINGWQTLLGGIFLLPFTLFFYHSNKNTFNFTFWASVSWLAIPVSIIAVLIWLWLLKIDSIKAGLWLFLCPIFGFLFAALLLHDKISFYTIAGVMMVLAGLLISHSFKRKEVIILD